jgi:lysyl-tRNA synthetase class 2
MTDVHDNHQDEQEQIRQRREKLTALREETIAFPTDFRRDVVVAELLAKYDEKSKEELEEAHDDTSYYG